MFVPFFNLISLFPSFRIYNLTNTYFTHVLQLFFSYFHYSPLFRIWNQYQWRDNNCGREGNVRQNNELWFVDPLPPNCIPRAFVMMVSIFTSPSLRWLAVYYGWSKRWQVVVIKAQAHVPLSSFVQSFAVDERSHGGIIFWI